MSSSKPSPISGPRSSPPGDAAARTDTMQRSRPRSLRTRPSYHQTHASAPGPSSVPVSPIFPHPSPSHRSLSSSPKSCSCCSPQHLRALRTRQRSLRFASTTSLSSPASASPLSRNVQAGPGSGRSTPSPSPSSRARKSRSISLSVPPSPAWLRPPLLTQLPLGLPRAPPTLAMSMQIHAPSPIMSTPRPTNTRAARRASRSRSRPASPSPLAPTPLPPLPQSQIRPPMRPPSRSERLLRDTLRRAEEHDRVMNLAALPSPSTFGASQPAHGFFVPPLSTPASPSGRARHAGAPLPTDAVDQGDWGSDDEDDEAEDGDNKRWLWRSPSSSSSSSTHGVGQQSQTQYPYHYISPRQQLQHLPELEKPVFRQRSRAQSDANPNGASHRAPGQQRQGRSASAAVPPHAYSSGTWHAHDAAHASAAHSSVYTPHEAVLRSRLEGVLRGAQHHERHRSTGASAHGSTDNSFASSRNISEGELSGPEVQPQLSYSPVSNEDEGVSMRTHTRSRTSTSASTASPPTHRRSSSAAPRSPARSSQSSGTSGGRVIEPLTPPPSPPFNPIAAAAQCKAMEGYVSFANVGLGVPGGEDEEESVAERRWLRWFGAR